MPSKYRITTDQGTYEVTVDDGEQGQSSDPKQNTPGSAGLGMTLIQKGLPFVASKAADFANNPEAWKTGKVVGELGGGLAGLSHGGLFGAAGGSYMGAKAGWRATNLAQRGASALANATRGPAQIMLNTVEPYLSPLSFAQSGLGFAQAQEPQRKDIGMLGIGPKVDIGELSNPNPTGRTYPSPSPSEQVQWVRDHIMQLLGR